MSERPQRAIDPIAWSWSPAERPTIDTVDLSTKVPLAASHRTAAADPARRLDTQSMTVAPVATQVVAVSLSTPKVTTRRFTFPHFDDAPDPQVSGSGPTRPGAPRQRATQPSGTGSKVRISVPRDIVKLEDRLFYVLQPPLDSWMADLALVMSAEPFGYQWQGIAYLYPRHAAVLADEMGLGKTMQAITAIRLLLHRGEVRRVLLICPKPLVTNWTREFALWAPEIPVAVIEGARTRREWQWRRADMPVMIANYELLLRDEAALTASDMHFDLVVLDESQRIKNRTSRTARIARAISRSRSWALTGTPVENRADDLVGIFDFVAPGLLSSGMRPRQMGRLAGDHVLRRTKDQVLTDLPPKLFRDADLSLTPRQRESYELAEEQGVLRLGTLGSSITIQHVLELVLRLKQICNFDPATGDSSKLERLNADLEEVAASGQKAIVFSQWVETIEKLAGKLFHFGPLQYHGKIPQRKRAAVLRRFREDPRAHVLLMSYGAGGVGLNLQFASYVFLFDRWWNPAVEDQAINRAHRIGTSRPVTVTRFLVADTIEERIDRILRDKRELFDTILSSAKTPRNLGLSREQIFGLFQIAGPSGPIESAA